MYQRSDSYELDGADIRKTGRDFSFFIIAAMLTFVGETVLPMLEGDDNFWLKGVAAPVIAGGIALAWRWYKANHGS